MLLQILVSKCLTIYGMYVCFLKKSSDPRFMICCDLCDEWYHGDCVGIKPEEGKCMEKNEIEFVCDSCKLMGAYTGKNDQVDHVS